MNTSLIFEVIRYLENKLSGLLVNLAKQAYFQKLLMDCASTIIYWRQTIKTKTQGLTVVDTKSRPQTKK